MANLEKIQILSRGFGDCIDLTRKITNVSNGSVFNIFAPPACAIVVLPKGAEIVQDLIGIIEHIVPIDKNYKFDMKNTNAFSHLRSTLLGRSVTVLKSNDEQIVLIDFDNKAQTRTVQYQVVG